MAITFSTVEQSSNESGRRLLVYGGSGMGKTVLVATLPAPVLLSAESGILSLRRRNLERMFGAGNPGITYNVPIIQIGSMDDLSEAYNWLTRSAEAQQFQSVALDSISEIAEVVFSDIKKQYIIKKQPLDPRKIYPELSDKMATVIRDFRDLPGKNVYMAAKQEPVKDEMTGVVKYGPSMPGSKLSNAMPYFFDEVLRLGVGKNEQGQHYRFLQCHPDMQYDCKDRSGNLDMVEPPNLSHIISKALS